jgi:DNA-directed RNA polymerase subunit K/omega
MSDKNKKKTILDDEDVSGTYESEETEELANSEEEYTVKTEESGVDETESENTSEEGDDAAEDIEEEDDVEDEKPSKHKKSKKDSKKMRGGEADGDDDHLELDPDEEAEYVDPDGNEEDNPAENEELADQDAEIDNEDDVDNEEGEDAGYDGEEGGPGPAKVCHVKNLNKEVIVDDDDSTMYAKLEYTQVPDDERVSDPVFTYYEIVRILGTRAQQFNYGAEPLVEGVDKYHPAQKSFVELLTQMTPFIIKRRLPGKKYELWRVDELELIHQIDDEFFVPKNLDLSKYTKKQKA